MPHGLPNVDELGADIYLFSTYKTYGPHQGLMVIVVLLASACPIGVILSMRVRFTNVSHQQGLITHKPPPVQGSRLFDALYDHHFSETQTATERCRAVHDLMRAEEIKRLAPLLSYVSSKNSLRLLGPNDPERRAPTVSVQTKENPAHIAEKLAQRGIAVGGDNFTVSVLLRQWG